jgi:hypothetical protein
MLLLLVVLVVLVVEVLRGGGPRVETVTWGVVMVCMGLRIIVVINQEKGTDRGYKVKSFPRAALVDVGFRRQAIPISTTTTTTSAAATARLKEERPGKETDQPMTKGTNNNNSSNKLTGAPTTIFIIVIVTTMITTGGAITWTGHSCGEWPWSRSCRHRRHHRRHRRRHLWEEVSTTANMLPC